jgi:hypothetical protein
MAFRYAHIRPHSPLGDPFCRESPKYADLSPRVTSFGDGSNLGGPARGYEALLQPRLEFGGSSPEMKDSCLEDENPMKRRVC